MSQPILVHEPWLPLLSRHSSWNCGRVASQKNNADDQNREQCRISGLKHRLTFLSHTWVLHIYLQVYIVHVEDMHHAKSTFRASTSYLGYRRLPSPYEQQPTNDIETSSYHAYS